MNLNNAFSFLVLGLLMHSTPLLAQAVSAAPVVAVENSVRMAWLEFMGWVIGGIGLGYLARDAAARVPALILALVPARFLRPVETRAEPVQMQMRSVVRVGITY